MDIIDIAIAKSKSGTVQDGSLTESKFSDALKMSAINDYVTPEMFGAVGDGVTNDTQALQDMFDSGKNVFLPNKTYLTDGNMISNITHIVSNHATFKAKTNLQSHLLYVNARIYLSGRIILNGDSKALNGILFDASGSSVIDVIDVSYCLVWGVYNIASPGITMNRITAYGCGIKPTTSVSYASNSILNIDGDLTDGQKSVLASQYAFPAFLYDTRETASANQVPCCVVSGYDNENNQFVKKVYGAFNNSSFSSVPCVVCIGGAIGIANGVNGQVYIGMIASTLCSSTLGMRSTYGHVIDRIYSQSDYVGVFTDGYHQGSNYGSLTFEGTKSGYNFATYLYDYSMINVRSTGYDENFSSKSLVCISGQNSAANVLPIIADFHLRKALPVYHVITQTPTINESSPRNLFVRTTKAFNLGLRDTYQSDASYNQWGIKTIYVMSPTVSTDHITITLASNLVSEGYTIKNGVNGVLEFERPSQYFKIEIFMQRKEFIVFVTSLNVATNIST